SCAGASTNPISHASSRASTYLCMDPPLTASYIRVLRAKAKPSDARLRPSRDIRLRATQRPARPKPSRNVRLRATVGRMLLAGRDVQRFQVLDDVLPRRAGMDRLVDLGDLSRR